jgi:hypothetical protein
MTQSQKEFEAWAGFAATLGGFNDGKYSNWQTQRLWEAWQASRTALVFELPKIHFDAYADERTQAKEEGKEIILDEFKYSLEQAGVTYK